MPKTTDINKLTLIIDELELETSNIKEFTNVLNKIDSLTKDTEALNKKNLENVNTHLSITKKINASANTIDSMVKDIQKNLQNEFLEQSKYNQKNYNELHTLINAKIDAMQLEIITKNKDQINQLEAKIESLQTSLEESIESLRPKKKKWFIF